MPIIVRDNKIIDESETQKKHQKNNKKQKKKTKTEKNKGSFSEKN